MYLDFVMNSKWGSTPKQTGTIMKKETDINNVEHSSTESWDKMIVQGYVKALKVKRKELASHCMREYWLKFALWGIDDEKKVPYDY